MEVRKMHPWDVSPAEAIAIQNHLRPLLIKENRFQNIAKIAGVDVSFKGGVAKAAVVVLSFPQLMLLDEAVAEVPVNFPYIPGLLAFREGPAVLKALRQLKTEPDLIIFDAQGYAHPRRLGLASHLGVLLNKPSIGCAKSCLLGQTRESLSPTTGAYVLLFDQQEVIGAVLRTKAGTAPLYVSVGHLIDLKSALHFVRSCVLVGERLPQTTILAHRLAGGQSLRKKEIQSSLPL